MRNALAHAGRSGRRVVSAFIATAFAQDDAEAARVQWRRVADQLRPKVPKLAALMDEAETDVLAYMTFPPSADHPTELRSAWPLASSALRLSPRLCKTGSPPLAHGLPILPREPSAGFSNRLRLPEPQAISARGRMARWSRSTLVFETSC